jgi:hypothetical protein
MKLHLMLIYIPIIYYEAVYDRLKNLPKENLRGELQRIAGELSQGIFPY